ncbi:MAG TPA: hypothetical protein VF974_04545 [Patescibacteria group bacterium]
MIRRAKKNLIVRVRQVGRAAENEAEIAARRFFGTFVKDIKRNWVVGLMNPKNWQHHLKLKGKSNVSQPTSPI